MPDIQRVKVVYEKPNPETTTARVVVSRYLPPDGPFAVVANEKATQSNSITYLCSRCGQEGALGREWLSTTGFSGDVRCPACHDVMTQT